MTRYKVASFIFPSSPPVKLLQRSFKREQQCGALSDSCILLWACAGWLIASLKRCSCQSSTFITPQHLVIVIPQCEKKVDRWVQVGAHVSKRSWLTKDRKKKKVISGWVAWHVKDLEMCGWKVHGAWKQPYMNLPSCPNSPNRFSD